MKNCYCGSVKDFEQCCEPYILGTSKPQTAEELMRSRYSAYAILNIEYIVRTTYPSTRKFLDSDEILTWAKSHIWNKLEIISTDKGTSKDVKGFVEFKAYYSDSTSELQVHHEQSIFTKELGKWFFVNGKVPN
jgi:SEC-C motif domain protein